MKKNKSKSKNNSLSRKLHKAIESKLALAFNEVASQYGRAKKIDKVIEKFAKKLSKKIIIVASGDSINPVIKEEEVLQPVTKEKVVKPATSKATTPKAKTATKKEVTE